ncbi:hypothetical protein R1flu_019963 [Riccia fluitans]|uniref:Uncharacterized protein n=1 Tax=Riccia fluitans TaxID=41844 RepID=A0ABD1ZKH5_9MARC
MESIAFLIGLYLKDHRRLAVRRFLCSGTAQCQLMSLEEQREALRSKPIDGLHSFSNIDDVDMGDLSFI